MTNKSPIINIRFLFTLAIISVFTSGSFAQADFFITASTANPSTIPQGGTTSFSFNLNNIGSSPGVASTVGYVWSDDNVLDAGDTNIGTYPVTSNYTGSSTISFNLNSNDSPGVYWLFIIADVNNTVAESNENNNIQSTIVTITCAAPNITNVNTSCQSSTYSAIVTFSGSTGATYDVYADWNGINYGNSLNGVSAGTWTISGIPQGQQVTIIVEDEIYFSTCFDTQNISAPSCGSASLKMNSAISISPSSPTTGGSMTVTATVKNFGSASWSGNLVMQLLNSTGGYITNLDLDTGLNLSSNGSHTLSFSTNNVTSSSGNYQIRIQQQNNGSGSWATVTPNGFSNPKSFTIQAAGSASLKMNSAISISPSSPTFGGSMSVTATVKNFGSASWSGNLVMQLLNSAGGYITDLDLDSGINLSVNGSHTLSFSTNNVTSSPGNYQIRIQQQNNGSGSWATVTPNGFSNPKSFTIQAPSGSCSTFNGLTPGTEEYDAAVCLCNAGYIQDNSNINAYNNIIREDLAKVAFLGVNRGNSTSVASSFPVPFDDLQNSSTGYHLYAKALSYLEYDDGISPFDRKFTNFNPGNPIQRRYAMKVLLETFDIAISYTSGGMIEGLNPGDDAYEYIKTAKDLGYISGNYPNAQDDIQRIDVFLVLYRILGDSTNNSCSGDCDLDCYPLPNENLASGDYFVPGQFLLNSLSRTVGLSEGYFDSYKKTSYSISGRNVNLEFTHLYNSFLLEIPSELRKVCPLGEGWSHSYNSYIIEEAGSVGGNTTNKLYVFWPNGSITKYNRANLANQTLGNYDLLSESGSTLTVTKKNQVKFIYTKHNGVWYLDKIEDRNGNFVDIVLENGAIVNNYTPKRVDKVKDQHNRVLEFYYPIGKNTLNRVRDVSGNRNVYFTVNNSGDLVNYRNAKGKYTDYQYGSNQYKHYLEHITLPEGNTIDVQYDMNRRVKQVKFPGVSQPFLVNAVPNYNGAQPYAVSMDNPSSNINSDMEYNASGRMTEHVSGNTTTTIGYNGSQLPTNVSVAGQTTTYAYDPTDGNLLTVNQPLGITHTYTYTALNDLKTYTDPKGKTTTYTYDGNDNLDKITDNMNFVTNHTINANGLVTSILNPEGINTTFTYNTYGNTKTTNLPLGITTTQNYDAISRNIKITNPLGQVTNMSYDVHDNVMNNTRVSASGNLTNNYTYDNNDNVKTINANGQVTSFNYNSRDLVESMTFGNDTKTYSYRNDNLIDKYTRPDGTEMDYTYDDQGRLIGDDYSSYTYDNRGNVKTIVKNGTTSFNYDAADRLKDYTDIYSKKTIYTYDPNSNVTKVTYPGGYYVDYVYDDNNRLTKTKFNNGTKAIDYTYFDDGRQKKVTYPNGTYTDYGYDAAGRMTSLVTKKAAGTIICSYTFTLDALGNHTNVVAVEPYTGPPHLAALTYNGSYNNENEQTSYGGSSMTYDQNGEQQTRDGRTMNWDNGGMITSSGNRDYVYDGMKLMRQANRAGNTRRYAWDVRGMGNIIVEYNGSGTGLYYYIHGNGLCARVSVSNNAEIHYYHGDYRGSTVAMTDPNQAVTHKYQYLPFGEIVQCEESDPYNPFKYVGKWGVVHEGGHQYYMRARQYDAQQGRFLSEDPILSRNLFTYALQNPMMMVDRSGKKGSYIKNLYKSAEKAQSWWEAYQDIRTIYDFYQLTSSSGKDILIKVTTTVIDGVTSKVCGQIVGGAAATVAATGGYVVGSMVGEAACGYASEYVVEELYETYEILNRQYQEELKVWTSGQYDQQTNFIQNLIYYINYGR